MNSETTSNEHQEQHPKKKLGLKALVEMKKQIDLAEEERLEKKR